MEAPKCKRQRGTNSRSQAASAVDQQTDPEICQLDVELPGKAARLEQRRHRFALRKRQRQQGTAQQLALETCVESPECNRRRALSGTDSGSQAASAVDQQTDLEICQLDVKLPDKAAMLERRRHLFALRKKKRQQEAAQQLALETGVEAPECRRQRAISGTNSGSQAASAVDPQTNPEICQLDIKKLQDLLIKWFVMGTFAVMLNWSFLIVSITSRTNVVNSAGVP